MLSKFSYFLIMKVCHIVNLELCLRLFICLYLYLYVVFLFCIEFDREWVLLSEHFVQLWKFATLLTGNQIKVSVNLELNVVEQDCSNFS